MSITRPAITPSFVALPACGANCAGDVSAGECANRFLACWLRVSGGLEYNMRDEAAAASKGVLTSLLLSELQRPTQRKQEIVYSEPQLFMCPGLRQRGKKLFVTVHRSPRRAKISGAQTCNGIPKGLPSWKKPQKKRVKSLLTDPSFTHPLQNVRRHSDPG